MPPRSSRTREVASPRPESTRADEPAPIEAPTASDVLALYRTGLTDAAEARLRTNAQLFRTLTRMEHTVSIPKQYRAISKVVRTPFVRDAWHRITAALVQNAPTEHVEPISESREATEAASIAERWTAAVRERMTKELGEDVLYESVRALVRDGESVLKVVHRADAWANFPARERDPEGNETEDAASYAARSDAFKRRAPLPFAARVVDRLSIVRGEGEFGDEWIIEYGEYPRADLRRRFGMAQDESGRLIDPASTGEIGPRVLGGIPRPEGEGDGPGLVTKVEYWDSHWWAVVVDGTMAPGFPKPNPYHGRLPYFVAKADSDSESPLYALRELVPSLDQTLTMKQTWAYLGAFANPVLEPVPGGQQGFDLLPEGDDGQPPPFRWEPGKMIQPPRGFRFSFAVPPPVGKDLDDLAALYRSLIGVAGVPAALRGDGLSGDSGYLYNQQAAAAMSLYLRLARSTQRQFEQAIEFLWFLVRYIVRDTVYVLAASGQKDAARSWLGLRGSGSLTSTVAPIDRLGPISLKIRPKATVDIQASAMVALQMVNAPKQLISRRYALEEFVGVENPDDMAEEIAVENALDESPFKELIAQDALRQAGLLPSEEPPPPLPPDPSMLPPGMLTPGPHNLEPMGIDGQAAAGMPAIPGLTMPLQPTPPVRGVQPGLTPGAPGAYPGLPSNQGPPLPGIRT